MKFQAIRDALDTIHAGITAQEKGKFADLVNSERWAEACANIRIRMIAEEALSQLPEEQAEDILNKFAEDLRRVA